MKYHQRDIVEVSFLFPDGTFKPHPAIIVNITRCDRCHDGGRKEREDGVSVNMVASLKIVEKL